MSGSIDPSRLTAAQLAALLSAASRSTATEQQINADLDAGAPQNADGTLHLVHYVAWLVAQAD